MAQKEGEQTEKRTNANIILLFLLQQFIYFTVEAHAQEQELFTNINAGLSSVYTFNGGNSGLWGDYDGDGDLDILLAGDTSSGGILKIYRNEGNQKFTDIKANFPEHFLGLVAWGDYDSDGDLDVVLAAGAFSKIYRNEGNQTFTDIKANLPELYSGSVVWGDYDGDGDLDILLTGWSYTGEIGTIYRNNGNQTFTDIKADLPAVGAGSTAWGDYDGDGDLDVLITGESLSGEKISKIYRNNGNQTFADINAGLTGVNYSSVDWGDYDNDGDLDLILIGSDTDNKLVSELYRNDGDSKFSNINANSSAGIPNASFRGNARWGDYNNDGYLDLLLTGTTDSTKIYLNNRNDTFTGFDANLPGVSAGSAAWGDYDGDGDLDILLTGITEFDPVYAMFVSGSAISAVFVNNGSEDSDGDGVTDIEEITNGTNQLDKGSVLETLRTNVCAEWNGFLEMYNIMEHVNMSNQELKLTSTLYDIKGQQQDSVSFKMDQGLQRDMLVHDMKGRVADSYGLVCSSFTGTPGELDGRMVNYRYGKKEKKIEFAFAMPFLNPRKGDQMVLFNTYQPSLDPKDAPNLVANWIQISNINDSRQTGTLYFHGMDGNEVMALPVSLSPHARFDASGHYFAASSVGVARWVPKDPTAEFQVRNVRYIYDNPGYESAFNTAFQLEGTVGTGELITAPLDTRNASSIVEIANTIDSTVNIRLNVYASDGDSLYTQSIKLDKYASYHLITDQILVEREGIVTIDADTRNSVIATVMQYGRTATQGIQYMYGIQAKQALGVVLRSSYNTYLNQGCNLLLVNPGESANNATISMTRYDGTEPVSPYQVTVPAHGLVNENICTKDQPNVYGVVTVQPETPNSLYGTVVRLGENDMYRFPTPARQ